METYGSVANPQIQSALDLPLSQKKFHCHASVMPARLAGHIMYVRHVIFLVIKSSISGSNINN